METSKEAICRFAINVCAALFALLFLTPCLWAGPLLSINIGPGGKLHTGPIKYPDAVWGDAKNLSTMTAGANSFPIVKGDLWFYSRLSLPGHNSFFTPGQQLLLTGQVDPDHDGGPHDREDDWGILIAAKLLNYQYVKRNGNIFFIANVLESIDPKLAALLGLHKTTYAARLELQLSQIRGGKQIYYSIDRGILTTGAVPEPASLLLLAIPLLWFATKRLITPNG